jgi:hypothetical protein
MGYITLRQTTAELNKFRAVGYTKGNSCGIVALDEYLTLKKGFPLFIAGAPFSGKTEFLFEILVNTSKLYGWKHFIYSGEVGDAHNIFAELVSKHMGKQYHKGTFGATDSEVIYSEQFIDAHFVIADHEKDFTIDDFYKLVDKAEHDLGIKFDTTSFDPFNDIQDDVAKFGGREDKYLAYALKEVRKQSKKNKRIDILVNHIADVKTITESNGVRWEPPARPNEWAGGRTWWRRAFTMLLVYRPPFGMSGKDNKPYEENETHIKIQKIKPKGIGKLGSVSIFWDWKKNQYYCDVNGQILYSCEKAKDFE